jgi:hypothetical protein
MAVLLCCRLNLNTAAQHNRSIFIKSKGAQDLNPVFCDSNRVFKMGGAFPVGRHHSPTVRENLNLMRAFVHHGL